ncbi:MAG: hypothetical protein BroJett015_05660 [Chloroflexota bacterium]|nr:MAG: hypothetical protein BroJett015_05660 [Chloroflexota bacterium]
MRVPLKLSSDYANFSQSHLSFENRIQIHVDDMDNKLKHASYFHSCDWATAREVPFKLSKDTQIPQKIYLWSGQRKSQKLKR